MSHELLEHSVIHLFHMANQSVSDIFSEQMSSDALTPRQFAVLSAVSKNEGLNQTSLVKETGIDRSTLADIIQRMLKKGLIDRKRTESDGRAYSVYMTELGKQLLSETIPNVESVDQRILDAVPEENRKEFVDCLVKIISTVKDAPVTPPASDYKEPCQAPSGGYQQAAGV